MEKIKFHCSCGELLEGYSYKAVKCPKCGRKTRAWIATEEVLAYSQTIYALDNNKDFENIIIDYEE